MRWTNELFFEILDGAHVQRRRKSIAELATGILFLVMCIYAILAVDFFMYYGVDPWPSWNLLFAFFALDSHCAFARPPSRIFSATMHVLPPIPPVTCI